MIVKVHPTVDFGPAWMQVRVGPAELILAAIVGFVGGLVLSLVAVP